MSMAETNAAVLLSAPKSAVSEHKKKKPARSLRFELTLQESTKETYSEFSYLDLVSKEKVSSNIVIICRLNMHAVSAHATMW